MSTTKPHSNSCQEYEQFLSQTYSSEDDFIREYRQRYYGKAESKDLYLLVLTKLRNALVAGNICTFKRFAKIIDYISDIESRTTLKTYYNDVENPIQTTNLVILACKYDKAEILKFVFSNGRFLEYLIAVDKNAIAPTDIDETRHNAFYYAVLSGNLELLDTLIKNWPGNYFSTRVNELDEVLSCAYEELKLKNVLMSENMEIFVERELINLRFFSNSSKKVKGNVRDHVKNIEKRIDLIIEKISFLKSEFSNVEELDERFIFIARFIAQNIYVLKRQLKFTYDRLPWEEIEFCLISFISSYVVQQDINLFYRTILNKSKLFNYLESFAKKLENMKYIKLTDIDRLANLPNSNRSEVVMEIIQNSPEFGELYNDYHRIRDIHSLQKICQYLNLALSCDPKEREGQLIITRALQVIGEYLKNTLEAPKMSNSTSELLLASLPKNTRKVIIDLRNSISHAYSLFKRTEIEGNTNVNFFIGVQNDMKRIDNVISEILYNNKMKMVQMLVQNIVDSKSLDEFKKIAEVLRNVKLDEMTSDNYKMMEHENLETLIQQLSDAISKKTDYEKELFKKIDEIFSSVKNRSKNIKTDYSMRFASLKAFALHLRDTNFDHNCFRIIKYCAKTILQNVFPQNVQPYDLKEICELLMHISQSAMPRLQGNDLDQFMRSSVEIFYIAEFIMSDMKWIETWRGKLHEKGSLFHVSKRNSSHSIVKAKYDEQLESKVMELQNILKNNIGINNEFIEALPSFRRNKHLLAILEMLVLDIMSIIGRSEKYLENNIFFLDDSIPLLTGKCLRNHLAHGNTLLDILFSDPSLAVILNAEKLISENIAKSKKKIGKLVKEDTFKLEDKYNKCITIITNQEEMFAALQEGNLDKLKVYIEKGADINARTIDLSFALHFASRGSSIEVVKFILDHGYADVNVVDMDGQNALHIAAAYGRKNLVKFFITEACMSKDIRDKCGKTPLHIAAINGHKDIVEILLKNNYNFCIKDIFGCAPLHYAIRYNHIDVAKLLLKKEADVDHYESMGGYTLLHIAAEFGNLEAVDFLLSQGANVGAKNDKGGIPLHPAALNGHLEVVKALILKGSDVNARVLDGCTPLHYAVEHGYLEVANFLLKHEANVNIADKTLNNTPLHYAAQDGYEEIVDALLEYKANANIPTAAGFTPLHFAIQCGHVKIVASLIKHGVDICAKNGQYLTALHYAAENGQKEIAEILLQHGAEINVKGQNNLTPLHKAAVKGHKDIVDLLIKNNARIEARDIEGNTPLHAAALNGNSSVIDLLIKNKAEVNVETQKGLTPLHAAAMGGHVDAIVILLKNNAEVNAKDSHGFTPLYPAIMQGHKDVVKLLIENQADINVKSNFDYMPFHTASISITPLLLAVQAGHKEIVEVLVFNKADVNAKCNGLIPLVTAVENNHAEIVEILISNGADINVENGEPLKTAVCRSNKDIISILLKYKARIDFKDSDNSTVLHLAVGRGHKEIVNTLIDMGADIHAVALGGITPLHIAAQRGCEEVVETLIANGADVNSCGIVSGTPLHLAAANGYSDVVEILRIKGAKINVKDEKSRTPLELAVGNCHLHVIKVLLQDKNINVNSKGNDDWTLLHIASQDDNLEMVKYLVDKGSDIFAKNTSGSKPIHIAAREGFTDIVEFFLSKGLNIEESGSANQTLLHYAVMKDRLEVVRYLIAQGANVNAKDENGSTPLHFAALFGFDDVIIVLLESGAAFNVTNKYLMTPLDMISEDEFTTSDSISETMTVPKVRKENVTNLLVSTTILFNALKSNNLLEVKDCIKSGAFVNAKNGDAETPLHYAAWKGCNEAVDVLLQNKANPNAMCSKRSTPLHYAVKFSHVECVKTLLYNGAIYNAVSNGGKTPLDFSTNKNIASLLKVIDDAFKKVKNCNYQVISDLNKIKDCDTLKAVMNASNKENKTLIALALQSKYSLLAKQLKQVSQSQDNVDARLEEAVMLLNKGIYQRSLSILYCLFEKRKQLFGPDNLATLEIQTYIAKGLYKLGNYGGALDLLQAILQKQKVMLGLDYEDTLKTRGDIALVYHRQGRNDEAFSIYQEVYQKQKEILGQSHLETVITQFHMALVLTSLGQYEEALNINNSVYKIRKNTLGADHMGTIQAQNNIALVLLHKEEYDDSLKIYNEVLEKKKSIFGISHPDTLRTLNSIGGIYLKQNKHQEALKIYQEVLNIQKKTLTQNNPELLNTQYNLSNVLFAQGKYIAALRVFKECYDKIKAVYGPSHQSVVDIHKKIEFINLKFKIEGNDTSEIFKYLQTDINVASNKGDIETVEFLLKHGADVNDKDVEGRTPLHFAVSIGHISIVNILLKKGADVTHATNKGNTPLHTATSKSNNKIVEILLQRVSRDKLNEFVNAKTASGGTTSLHVAAKNGCVDIVKLLLKFGATYNITNKEGKKPVDLSSDQKVTNLLQLIDKLFKGVRKGSVEAVDKLKVMKPDEFSAVTNARNTEGHGLLQVACIGKERNIASMLLELLKKKDHN